MGALRYAAITGMFEVLWATRLAALIRTASRARGVIFTLHRVLPDDPADFSPNSILQVKPEFLDFAIQRIRKLGYDIVDLGEGVRRIESEFPEKRFAIFTFDDAYRDNLKYALPVLRKNQCPFTLYVPTALVDGVGEVWWQALEDIIAQQAAIAVTEGGENEYVPTATLAEKQAAYDLLYAKMRAMRSVGVPYTDAQITAADSEAREQAQVIAKDLAEGGVHVDPDTKMVATIAYLQRLGAKPAPKKPAEVAHAP